MDSELTKRRYVYTTDTTTMIAVANKAKDFKFKLLGNVLGEFRSKYKKVYVKRHISSIIGSVVLS